MDLELRNKHVVVSGGSRGIGLACARAFVEEGASVTLLARDGARLAKAAASMTLAAGAAVRWFAADLSLAERAASVFDQVEAEGGPVHVLVNAAGSARRWSIDELEVASWHSAMDAKFFPYLHLLDPVLKRMAQRGEGSIVNVVGMGGKVAIPTHLPGGSANAALMLASVGLAAAYAPRGIRVNVVNPGTTWTDRQQEGLAVLARSLDVSPGEAMRQTQAAIPMGRFAEPSEVANLVVFLASRRASYITGAVIGMDGCRYPIVV